MVETQHYRGTQADKFASELLAKKIYQDHAGDGKCGGHESQRNVVVDNHVEQRDENRETRGMEFPELFCEQRRGVTRNLDTVPRIQRFIRPHAFYHKELQPQPHTRDNGHHKRHEVGVFEKTEFSGCFCHFPRPVASYDFTTDINGIPQLRTKLPYSQPM